jgi:hypothetical protein
MNTRSVLAVSALLAVIAPAIATAQTNVSPNLGAGLGSFYTDRYTPPGFNLLNGIQGRNNVLQIDINSTSDAANRGGQNQTFYNTQGKKTDVNTAGSWLFQSDLFVQSSWANAQSGYVRTDIWATATDDALFQNPSQYPIVGFTNYGGAARFRGYDVNADAWIDFSNSINFGSWNTLGMGFDLATNTFSYYVNGVLAGSLVGAAASTGVANVMYQAYNFNDPAIGVSGNAAYSAQWSNTSTVPEPSTYALMASGLLALGLVARRRRNAATVSV